MVLIFNLLSHRTRSDGTNAIVARWKATAVYRAMEGTWKSIHVHWSHIKAGAEDTGLRRVLNATH